MWPGDSDRCCRYLDSICVQPILVKCKVVTDTVTTAINNIPSKEKLKSFAISATPLCQTSGEAQVTRTPHGGHAPAVRKREGEGGGGGTREGLCGFLWVQRAEVNCVSFQMDSHTKTGKVYLQPHKAGKVSTFKCCCLRVWMIHSASGFYCKESWVKGTVTRLCYTLSVDG